MLMDAGKKRILQLLPSGGIFFRQMFTKQAIDRNLKGANYGTTFV